MTEDQILELINRRRRQILVHSVIYYRMNDNIISDSQWTEWAMELMSLQKQYPELAKKGFLAKDFEDFDTPTGAFLPLDDDWAQFKAAYLLRVMKNHD